VLDSVRARVGRRGKDDMSPGTVLVVDDEPEVQQLLQDFLTDRGYEVLLAADASEALALLGARRPDLVLLDIALPGMDGLEALKRMAASDPGLRVIVITANTDIGLTAELLGLGAVDYIPKPFDLEYLDQAVRVQLAASRDP
jgi:DNA-binding response OmpR family regulator